MTIQKSGERTAAKVFGIANACMAVITAITGLIFLIIWPVMAGKYASMGGSLNSTWRALFPAIGFGGLFGGLAWCAICWFTLKTIYTSTSKTPMIVWAIINLLFVFPIPLFVLMIIIAVKDCDSNH